MHRIGTVVVEFFRDFTNRNAISKSSKLAWKDLLSGFTLIFAAVISLSANLNLLGSLFPFFTTVISWVPLFTLTTALLWSIWTITSKKKTHAKTRMSFYNFHPFLRTTAKACFILSLFLIPETVDRLIYSLKRFPDSFEGYLVYEQTGLKAKRASITLFDERRHKISIGIRETDDDGYWIIRSTIKPPRNAYLEIVSANCESVKTILIGDLLRTNLILGKTDYTFNLQYKCK